MINKINRKELIFVVCCVVALVLFFGVVRGCHGMDFCEFVDEVQQTYCETVSTTTTVHICPTTTTTSLPVPEFCGEITNYELMDLVSSTYETFWDSKYRLISKESLEEFLECIPTKPKRDWQDCDDFAKQLLGEVMVWAPGIAFGIAWVTNEDKTQSHAVNVMVDCNLDIWKIEAKWGHVQPWDGNSYVILLREGERE